MADGSEIEADVTVLAKSLRRRDDRSVENSNPDDGDDFDVAPQSLSSSNGDSSAAPSST